jgi:hypothetical protein
MGDSIGRMQRESDSTVCAWPRFDRGSRAQKVLQCLFWRSEHGAVWSRAALPGHEIDPGSAIAG